MPSILFLVLIVSQSKADAQILQDLTCPSCVTIPNDKIDLYKKLFPLIIWTDEPTYTINSVIAVHGHLRPENAMHPITITVTNPIGNIVTIEQISPSSSGDFTVNLNTGSRLWSQEGSYIIKAQSGPENRRFSTNINLISLAKGSVSNCTQFEITVPADNAGVYCIPFKLSSGHTTGVEGFLNTKTKTLSIDVRGTNIDSITLEIPRQILDAKLPTGNDSNFIVLFNGQPANFIEHEITKEGFRTLKITYPPDRKGKIEIIGTTVIPEFGSISILILFVSIVTILVLSKPKIIKFSRV